MFNLICKSLPHLKHSIKPVTATHRSHIIQLNKLLLSTSPSQEAAKPIPEATSQDSFAVNYFMKTCGFDRERALSACKYVHFDKPDKPDAVISLLKNKGFTHTQVTHLINTFPSVVLSDPNKTLLPKIEFFESKGFSKTDLPLMLLVVPGILLRSLVKYIIPTYNFLRNLLGRDENAIIAIKRCPLILCHLHSHVVPNIESLRDAGVPDARIARFLKGKPLLFVKRPDRLNNIVDKIKEMGIYPVSSSFVAGVSVLASLSRESLKEKMELYRRWGCSEDEVLAAFKIYPGFMMVSKAKIERIMDILVNEMGWESSKVLKNSYLLTYSLGKRFIPRCSVYQALLSKGLIKEQFSLITLISRSDEYFLEKFVLRYEKEAPELLRLYQEMLTSSSALQ